MKLRSKDRFGPFILSWPSRYFRPEEVCCKGDGTLDIDLEALLKLDLLRREMGAPLIINSAYRSPEHNHKIGGSPKSQHVEGKAFDISLSFAGGTKQHSREMLTALAKEVGFTGIGQYDTFVHVDLGPKRSWDYRKKGGNNE